MLRLVTSSKRCSKGENRIYLGECGYKNGFGYISRGIHVGRYHVLLSYLFLVGEQRGEQQAHLRRTFHLVFPFWNFLLGFQSTSFRYLVFFWLSKTIEFEMSFPADIAVTSYYSLHDAFLS